MGYRATAGEDDVRCARIDLRGERRGLVVPIVATLFAIYVLIAMQGWSRTLMCIDTPYGTTCVLDERCAGTGYEWVDHFPKVTALWQPAREEPVPLDLVIEGSWRQRVIDDAGGYFALGDKLVIHDRSPRPTWATGLMTVALFAAIGGLVHVARRIARSLTVIAFEIDTRRRELRVVRRWVGVRVDVGSFSLIDALDVRAFAHERWDPQRREPLELTIRRCDGSSEAVRLTAADLELDRAQLLSLHSMLSTIDRDVSAIAA